METENTEASPTKSLLLMKSDDSASSPENPRNLHVDDQTLLAIEELTGPTSLDSSPTPHEMIKRSHTMSDREKSGKTGASK